MITVRVNIGQVTAELKGRLEKLKDTEYLLRPVAQEQIRLMHDRIHGKGLASDGGQIGTYSRGYLKIRQEKYNRKPDSQVIISLTRQLENDYTVVPTTLGYGVGFNNRHNFDKSQWVENTYKKKIFDPTEEELNEAIAFINELTEDALNS